MDGDRYERQLVNYLAGHHFAAIRMGSSGAGTTRALPDVLAMQWIEQQHHYLWAIELKATSDPHAYVEGHEVEKLRRFATLSGFDVYLGGRFKRDSAFYLKRPENCYRTDAGTYRITQPESIDEWDGVVIPDPEQGEVIR